MQLVIHMLKKSPLFVAVLVSDVYSSAELNRNPPDGVSVGLVDDSNIFLWELMVMGPPDTLYEGGFFKAKLEFPRDFPNNPPTMTFTSEMWHPNGISFCFLTSSLLVAFSPSVLFFPFTVYEDGRVCISILHPPGEDKFNEQETAEERWRPVLGVESIIISVISMLSDPNDESPANLDAAIMWRTNESDFKRRVRQIVRKSQDEL